LVLAFDDFRAGPIPLRDLVNGTRPCKFLDFQIFLKVLEVYGLGFDVSSGEEPKSTDPKSTIEDQTIEALQQILSLVERVQPHVS
jgi:hypothetical protein